MDCYRVEIYPRRSNPLLSDIDEFIELRLNDTNKAILSHWLGLRSF